MATPHWIRSLFPTTRRPIRKSPTRPPARRLTVTVLEDRVTPATFTVDDDGGADFTTIQEAIDAATDGDTISVMPGTYAAATIDRSITLVSTAGKATTIINGAGVNQGAALRVNTDVQNVTIGGMGTGFTLNAATGDLAALYVVQNNDGISVSGNALSGGSAHALLTGGLQDDGSFLGNSFSGSGPNAVAYVNGTASLSQPSTNVDFVSNTFTGLTGAGLLLGHEATGSDLTGNTLSGANSFAQLELWGAGGTVTGNAFNGAAGLAIADSADAYSEATLAANNSFTPGAVYNTARNDVYTLIQGAINAASSGETIVIGAGAYSENVSISQNSLTLQGPAGGGATTSGSLSATGTGTLSVNDLAFAGGTISNYAAVNLGSSSTTAGTYTVNGNSFSRAGDQPTGSVTFSSVGTVGVTAGGGNDTFHVTATTTGPIYTLHGSGGTDTLNYNAGGAAATASSGTITADGKVTVNYTSIENLNILNSTAVTGTNGNDTLTVRKAGGDLQYQLNGGGWVTLTNPASFTFDGGDGNDAMTVDFSAGSISQVITFNGQGQSGSPGDTLNIVGGSTTSQTFGFINDSDGSVVLAGALAGTIHYTGLEPITSSIDAATVELNYSGASETISVTAAGAQTKVNSTAGEEVTFNNPTALLRINAGGGNDTVTVDGLGSGFAAALTIDGEAGTDAISLNTAVTYAANKSLTLAAETINITAAQTLSGTGAVSAVAGRNISVSGAVSTTNGSILLDADTGSQVTGDFIGVDIQADVTSTGGTVTVEGRGGTGSTSQLGVRVKGGADVSGASTQVTGRGGNAAGSGNAGVTVTGSGSRITSAGGSVSVTGTGNGVAGFGVHVVSGGTITAGGTGSVTVTGTGSTAGTGNNNYGVYVHVDNAAITSNDGAVSVTGVAGGTGSNSDINIGVLVQLSGSITAGGTNTLTVNGTGGAGSSSHGVQVSDSTTHISSAGGVTVNGTGGGTSGVNHGVNVLSSGRIESTGSTLSVSGTKGGGATSLGINVSSGTFAAAGNATLTGPSNSGITVASAATANFGSLTVNAGSGAVSVFEDSDTILIGSSTAGSLVLSSAGVLTNAVAASLTVTGNANLSGTSIDLGNKTGDSFLFGSLTFNSTGAVSIAEDSQIDLAGTNTANSLVLSTTGAIFDNAGTSLTVTTTASLTAAGPGITLADNTGDVLSVGGKATFAAGSSPITVAANGTVNFGSLTFSTTAAVSISEDSATELAGSSTAGSLSLTAAGNITDTGSVSVAALATLNAGTNDIVLDTTTNQFASVNVTAANAELHDSTGGLSIQAASVSGVLRLTTAGGGGLGQTGGVTAGSLGIRNAGGNIDLTSASNQIGTVAIVNSGSGSTGVVSAKAGGLTVGTVADGETFTAVSGVTTNGLTQLTGQGVLLDVTQAVSTNGGNLTLAGSGSPAIRLGANLSTDSAAGSGNLLISGSVALTADVAIDTDGGGTDGNVTFNSQVDSAASTNRALSVTAGDGTVQFMQNVGSNVRLSEFTVATSGTTILPSVFAAAGGISVTATTKVVLRGATLEATSNGSVTVTGPTELQTNVTARSGATGTGTGTVTFNGTVDSDAAARSLTLNTAGTTVLGGNVGGTNRLSSLTTNAGGSTRIDGSQVKTTGNQTFGDPVQVSAAAVTFDAGSGAVNFTGTLNGVTADTSAVTVTASGLTTFGGAVGGTNRLLSLTSNGSGTTAVNGGSVVTQNGQTFTDDTTVGAITSFTSNNSGDITFSGTLNGGFAVTVNTAGTTTFGGAVGGTSRLTSLTTDAAGSTSVNTTTVNTTGGQTFGDPVTVGANTTFDSSGSGGIQFAGTLNGGFAVTVNTAGTTTFGGAVGGTTPLTSLTTNAGGTTNINGGSVKTTGGQTFGDPVTVGANTTFESAGGGNIQFAALSGGFAVDVNTSGTTTFGGAVSVAQLTTDAGGGTTISGGAVTTTGTQTYHDDVTVSTTPATLTTTDSNVSFGGTTTLLAGLAVSTGSGDTTFTGAVSGANALSVTSTGTTTFTAAVGSPTALASVSVSGGTTAINGGSVTTTGTQSYNHVSIGGTNATLTTTDSGVTVNGTTTLGENLTISAGSGDVTFTGAVDGGSALAVNSTGTTTFTAAVGGTNALASLTTNAGGTTNINGGTVKTTGTQTYNDAVTLGASTTLTGSTVVFHGTVVGNTFALNIVGNAVFGDQPSDTVTGLASLDVSGTSLINTSNITSTGSQMYGGAVTLGTDTTLTAGTGAVKFNGNVVGGGNDLSVVGNADIGDAAADSLTGVDALSVTGATAVRAGTVTSNSQLYGGNVMVVNSSTLTATSLTAIAAPISVSIGSGQTLTVSINTGGTGTIDTLDGDATTALVKAGDGLLTVTGSSTGMLGTTTANAGTLRVNGNLGNSATTVNAASLQGTGTVGPLVVNAGGSVAPGDGSLSIGTLFVNGTATFHAGSFLFFEASSASVHDRLAATGDVMLNGTTGMSGMPVLTTVTLLSYTPAPQDTLAFITSMSGTVTQTNHQVNNQTAPPGGFVFIPISTPNTGFHVRYNLTALMGFSGSFVLIANEAPFVTLDAGNPTTGIILPPTGGTPFPLNASFFDERDTPSGRVYSYAWTVRDSALTDVTAARTEGPFMGTVAYAPSADPTGIQPQAIPTYQFAPRYTAPDPSVPPLLLPPNPTAFEAGRYTYTVSVTEPMAFGGLTTTSAMGTFDVSPAILAITPITLNTTHESVYYLTNQPQVKYRVTFSDPIAGLTASNLGVVYTSGDYGSTLTGPGTEIASVTPVTASAGTGGHFAFDVVVNTGTGDGKLNLNLVDTTGLTGKDMVAVNAQTLASPFYDLDRTAPTVNSFQLRYGPNGSKLFELANAGRLTLPWDITGAKALFSENVNSLPVSYLDFALGQYPPVPVPVAGTGLTVNLRNPNPGTLPTNFTPNLPADSLTGFTFQGGDDETLTWTFNKAIDVAAATFKLNNGTTAVRDAAGNVVVAGSGTFDQFNQIGQMSPTQVEYVVHPTYDVNIVRGDANGNRSTQSIDLQRLQFVITASAANAGTPTFPANAGDPSQFAFYDVYKDGVLNTTDLLYFDVTGDGLITVADRDAMSARMNRYVGTLPLPTTTPNLIPPQTP